MNKKDLQINKENFLAEFKKWQNDQPSFWIKKKDINTFRRYQNKISTPLKSIHSLINCRPHVESKSDLFHFNKFYLALYFGCF